MASEKSDGCVKEGLTQSRQGAKNFNKLEKVVLKF
jgi:hypothetical protein